MAPARSQRNRCWCISISTAVFIIIIIAITVPLALLLPEKGQKGKTSSILLPLYIYPQTNATWSPLYSVLETHPQLKIIAIVNPSNGPGTSEYPNNQYTAALEQLSQYPNVETVGYVRTGYASKPINDVVSEIEIYAGWSSNSSSLAMHGIFFDESPHAYSAEAVGYMASINSAVKNATGLLGGKTVIHNPGTIPDARYDDPNTDITVMFEASYPAYQTATGSLRTLQQKRSSYSVMIHTLPTMSIGDLRKFVDEISQDAEFLFTTNNDQHFYESFGSQWSDFADVVPT